MEKISTLYEFFKNSTGISTDTRKIEDGNIFFALKGDNFDGNRYAAQAIESGAKLAVVDDTNVAKDESYFLVADVLTALQNLATYHRQQLGIPIVSLTGSNGKTTTKELIREVLATKFNISATGGNFNNHIGVPLTLLQMTEDTEIGVVEMGANHIGEIANLCELAQPTHGMITNIGKAHLEGFGGYEGVLRGKTELYNYLIKNEGQIFINSDDSVLMNMAKRMKDPKCYNSPNDFLECEMLSSSPFVKYRDEHGTMVESQLIGEYNFKNIAAALCIGKYFEVNPADANKAIANYIPENNRSQIIDKGSNRIILDAYNANPNSMNVALDNIAGMSHPKKVVILGDMFELGDDEAAEHQAIVDRVSAMDFELAVVCGKASATAATGVDGVLGFESRDLFHDYLKQNPINNALILVKGSRGMGLEALVENL